MVNLSHANVTHVGVDANQSHPRSSGALDAKVLDEAHVLIETDSPGEFAALSGVVLRRRQGEWRVQSHVGRDVIEDLIVTHAESTANYRVVAPDYPFGKAWRVSEPQHRPQTV